MTIDVVIILASLLIVLIGAICVAVRLQKPLAWCRSHVEYCKSATDETDMPDVKWGPNPIKSRDQLLDQIQNTSLLAGDVGNFVLRRERVEREGEAAFWATFSVSLSLLLTIIGLILSLQELKLDLPQGDTPDLRSVLVGLREPLSRIPRTFIPTGAGLLLALVCLGLQRQLENRLEEAWAAIDRFTQVFLLRKHVKTDDARERLAEVTGSLVKVVKKFDEAASRAAKNLSELDQAKWAENLRSAVDGFSSTILATSERLDKTWKDAADTLSVLPAVTAQMAAIPKQMENVATRLQETAEQTLQVQKQTTERMASVYHHLQDGVVKLQERSASQVDALIKSQTRLEEVAGRLEGLGSEVLSLSNSFNALNATLSSWTTSQSQQTLELQKTVVDLHKTVQPLAQEWSHVAVQLKDHARLVGEGMDKVKSGLDGANITLKGVLDEQQSTFRSIATQVGDSLREGHQRFLIEVGDRFDQGQGLFERLEALRASLVSTTEALTKMQEELHNATPVAANLQPSAQDLVDAMLQVREQSRQLDERLNSAAVITNIEQIANDVRTAVDTLSLRPVQRRGLMEWLFARPNGGAK